MGCKNPDTPCDGCGKTPKGCGADTVFLTDAELRAGRPAAGTAPATDPAPDTAPDPAPPHDPRP